MVRAREGDGEGEPEGWNRASKLGYLKRRRPGGFGPETEYVDPFELEELGYDEPPRPGEWLLARARERR